MYVSDINTIQLIIITVNYIINNNKRSETFSQGRFDTRWRNEPYTFTVFRDEIIKKRNQQRAV